MPSPYTRAAGTQRVGRAFHVGSEVAHRGEAQPGNHRVAGHVDVFVNPAGLKPSVEMDMPVAGNEFAVHRVGEAPLRAWDHGPFRFARVPHCKLVPWILRVGDGIFAAAQVADDKVSERNFLHHLRRHEVAAEQPTDRLPLVPRDRRVKTQRALAGSIPLPSERYHAVAVAQQPSVSGVVRSVPVAAIDQADDACPAAVRDLEQQGTITLAGILGPQGHEVGGELDLSVVQVRRPCRDRRWPGCADS